MSRKKGFTLIEVAIFLVITGALFVAVTVGVQNSISQQRFNDSVQSFVDFLRNVYSEVTNVENNESAGRSEKAIYGKLITFGETSKPSEVESSDARMNSIYVYTVIGDIKDISNGNTLDLLNALNADVVVETKDENSSSFKPAGLIESYVPRWSAQIENTNNFEQFIGAILIVRHPKSGTVYTYVKKGSTIEVNDAINKSKNGNGYSNVLIDHLKKESFKIETVDFCVNPEGDQPFYNRRDVRIKLGARNASAVNIVSDEDSACREGEEGA